MPAAATDDEAVKRVVAEVEQSLGPINILVNKPVKRLWLRPTRPFDC